MPIVWHKEPFLYFGAGGTNMSGQYCVDANVFITAWYDRYIGYPPRIFPSLWKQLSECRSDIVLIKPIFDEIEPISPPDKKLSIEKKREKYPLRVWMEENQFDVTDINDETKAVSLDLEKEYEINSESKGAGQNDITLIAYAKIMDKTVVTFEAKQPQKPGKKSNYKIPLICQEQDVACINFIDMLDSLNIRV